MTDTDTQKQSKAKSLGITVLWGPSNSGKTSIAGTLADGLPEDAPPIHLIDHDDGSLTLDTPIREGKIKQVLLVSDPAPSPQALAQTCMQCVQHIREAADLAKEGKCSGIVLDGLSTLYQTLVMSVCLQNQSLAFDMSTDGKTTAAVMGLYRGPARAIGMIIEVLGAVAKLVDVPVVVVLHSKEGMKRGSMESVMVPDLSKNVFQKLRRYSDLTLRVSRYPGRSPEMSSQCQENTYTRVRGGVEFEQALNNYLGDGGHSLREIAQLWEHVSDTAVQ